MITYTSSVRVIGAQHGSTGLPQVEPSIFGYSRVATVADGIAIDELLFTG